MVSEWKTVSYVTSELQLQEKSNIRNLHFEGSIYKLFNVVSRTLGPFLGAAITRVFALKKGLETIDYIFFSYQTNVIRTFGSQDIPQV